MSVKLAAQTVSSSVTSALQFLQKEGHQTFQGCDATRIFI